MRTPYLLPFAVAASLAGSVLAQNDDCAGALNVAVGANGPFTTVGSTTSTPPFTCGDGGSDIWFRWVATGFGTLDVTTCGSGTGYDTVIEVFNGTPGCGALGAPINCNDDSTCWPYSLVNVPITTGTTYYIRVGGWNSGTGVFTLTLTPSFGASSRYNFGAGCVGITDSFHEQMNDTAFDLGFSTMTLIWTSPGYLALPGSGVFVAPSASAVILGLGDDTSIDTPLLTTGFPHDGGVSNMLRVCSNGFVATAAGNASSYNPNPAEMLSNPATAWYCWHDYSPNLAAGGRVKFEEIAGVAYITWDGVYSYGTTSPSTFQMQFDEASGTVVFVWQAMDLTGGAGDYLVGYSPGGLSFDGGTRDISATLPSTFSFSSGGFPLVLEADANPIVSNTINLTTSNLTPTTPFGAVLLSLNGFNPGLDLTGLGMAGCRRYQGGDATLLFLPLGAPTFSTPLVIPNFPGVHIFAQSVAYDPATLLTVLKATSSNGVDLGIGTY